MQLLYDTLKKYAYSDAYPFHMPGHKRRMGEPSDVCAFDITEIDGFDNLHHAEGILKEAQERAARLYGSEETYYLVNGSTAGILAAISACTTYGGKILMARNCHKAAYHAAELRGLHTAYVYPRNVGFANAGLLKSRESEWMSDNAYENGQKKLALGDGSGLQKVTFGGSICPGDVQRILEKDREIQAVLITSPTYEGIVSDVRAIAEITHFFGIPLIVDEAHGAHFGFHSYFPENSVRHGADIVIHSLHKTLPSMTQTALLHKNSMLVESERIQKYLGIYQTSSPSYILMASMDACISLLEEQSQKLFEEFAEKLREVYRQAQSLKHIHMLNAPEAAIFAKDASKLVLEAENHSGKWLSSQLRERFHLEMEMEAGGYVIALTSLADTKEGFDRLFEALRRLDCELDREMKHDREMKYKELQDTAEKCPKRGVDEEKKPAGLQQVFTIAETDGQPQERILLSESEGRISAEYIYLYPPGIPLVVPGEKIDRKLLDELARAQAAGLSLQGLSDYSGRTIRAVLL